MDCEALLERFGEEKCLGMRISGTKEERLLAMIEALGGKPLHAISIIRAHRIRPGKPWPCGYIMLLCDSAANADPK